MRRIGLIQRATDAKRFGDYLLTKGITTQVRPSDEGYVIWVRDENKVAEAAEELKRFQEDPSRPEYNQGRQAAQIRSENEKRERDYRRRQISARAVDHARTPLTTALTVLTVAIFFLPINEALLYFSSQPELGPIDIRQGEVWRLVTPILMHADSVHLILNMLIFWQLSGLVERVLGQWKLGFLILFLAVGSNCVEFLWQVARSDPAYFKGMSGVIYGLVGFIVARNSIGGDTRLSLSPTFVWLVMAWLFLGLIGALEHAFGIKVANGAHLGGLILGCVAGAIPHIWDRRRKPE